MAIARARTRPATAWAELKYLQQKVAVAEAGHVFQQERLTLLRAEGAKLALIREAEWECARAAARIHVSKNDLAEYQEAAARPAKSALVG